MKSKLLALIIVFSITQHASTAKSIRKAGAKLGASYSTIVDYNSPWLDASRVWGVTGGAFIEWLDVPAFSLLTEAHLMQKGFINNSSLESGSSNLKTYLSMPVLGKVRLSADPVTPYFMLGPRIDFLITSTTQKIFHIRSTITGATMGIGFEVPSSQYLELGFEFRISPDFTSHGSFGERNTSIELLFVFAP